LVTGLHVSYSQERKSLGSFDVVSCNKNNNIRSFLKLQ
jgi:hypothetical protein